MLSACDSRSRTTPRTPLASIIPALLPFSLPAIPSSSLVIVSWPRSSLTHRASSHGFSVSAIYGLTRSSTGDYYSIEPSNKFTYVDADGRPKDLYATVEGIAKVKLPGDLATSRRIHNKRDNSYIDCSPVQQEEIVMAGGSAQMIVEEAYTYMSHVTFGSERYEKWFGPYEDHNRDIILETFQNIWQNTDFLSYTYDCSTCEKTKNHIVGDVQTVAYVSTCIFRPRGSPFGH